LVLVLVSIAIDCEGGHTYCTMQIRLVAEMFKLFLSVVPPTFNVVADNGV